MQQPAATPVTFVSVPCVSVAIALLLAGCAAPGRDWPSLNPRPGEISPMVPRAVPGVGRCLRDPGPECAPPNITPPPPAATDMPAPRPPLTTAAATAELSAIEAIVADVEATASPRRAARDVARRAAAGAPADSAAAARLEAAQSNLAATLAPLAGADYRRAALLAELAEVPDGAALLPRVEALAARIAALQDQ